jgi:hypothetical protein
MSSDAQVVQTGKDWSHFLRRTLQVQHPTEHLLVDGMIVEMMLSRMRPVGYIVEMTEFISDAIGIDPRAIRAARG